MTTNWAKPRVKVCTHKAHFCLYDHVISRARCNELAAVHIASAVHVTTSALFGYAITRFPDSSPIKSTTSIYAHGASTSVAASEPLSLTLGAGLDLDSIR